MINYLELDDVLSLDGLPVGVEWSLGRDGGDEKKSDEGTHLD